jgi:hypothetical protein
MGKESENHIVALFRLHARDTNNISDRIQTPSKMQMPQWFQLTYNVIANGLPLVSDALLGVGGLLLSWEKTATALEPHRKRIAYFCCVIGFLTFAFRFVQQRRADTDTQTLVNNTKTLVNNTNELVKNSNRFLSISSAITALRSQINDIDARIAEAKGNPELVAQLRREADQKRAALTREIANGLNSIVDEMQQRELRYITEVQLNNDEYKTAGPPETLRENAPIAERNLNAIKWRYREDLHTSLLHADHLREALTEGRPLTPDDKKYAAIIQSGLDGDVLDGKFPLGQVWDYFRELAKRSTQIVR